MTAEPILASPSAVQIHLLFAVLALFLGPVALFRARRDRLHKGVGYVCVTSMAGLALTGFFIESNFALIGPFGPIHLLCIVTLWGLWRGMRAIWQGQVAAHRATMRGLWFGAVGFTGLLTLAPGRTLNRALFGEASLAGLFVIALGALLLIWLMRRAKLPIPLTKG